MAKFWIGLLVHLFIVNTALSVDDISFGSSPNPVGSGARPLGQGNAFIAIADDATAASWNPAGLSQLEKPEFSFAIETRNQGERTNPGRVHPETKSKEGVRFSDFNFISVVLPVFLAERNMTFSLNYLQLTRFDKRIQFPYDIGAENIDVNIDFEQEGLFSVVAASYGVNVTTWLALGVTLNIWNHDITQTSRYEKTTHTVSDLISPDGSSVRLDELKTNQRVEVDEGYSWVLGGLYRLNKEWTVAGVVKPPFTMEIDTLTREPTSQGKEVEKNDARLTQPLIIGLGTAWRPSDSWTVSADLTWTHWSSYELREGGKTTNPITSGTDKLDDTITLRLGCETIFIHRRYLVPLRCGIGYDPGPAVDEVDDFYTISFGAGVQIKKRVNLDFAYEFRWGNDVNGAIFESSGPIRDVTQNLRAHRFLASVIYYF